MARHDGSALEILYDAAGRKLRQKLTGTSVIGTEVNGNPIASGIYMGQAAESKL